VRVYKKKRKDKKTGERVEYRNYTVDFKDHREVRRRLTAFPDKKSSDELSRKLGHLIHCKVSDSPITPELHRWLDSLPERILTNLDKWDIFDYSLVDADKNLEELVQMWKSESLIPGGSTMKHAKLYVTRVKKIIDGCDFDLPSDIKSGKVASWLHSRIEKSELSVQTRNHYATAFNAFCTWLNEEGLLPGDAYKSITKQRLNGAVERDRRALSEQECVRLLEAARDNGRHHGLTGPERALLYQLAMETGLRWNECLSLKPTQINVDHEPYTVHIEAKDAKNRKDACLPLNAASSIIDRLRHHISGRESADPLFTPWQDKGAPMIRRDLEAAGIPYEDENGQVVDFHSLRHTFATTLANTCRAHPKTMQELLRVSTIDLVMKYYTHSGFQQQLEAVSGLPVL